RALASESVEAVAARAVRTTLAALQGAEIGRGDGGELARELADLRGLSEANQRRIIDALAGVRDALERVTGRFAGHNARPNEAEAIAPAPIAAEETTSTTERARAAALEAASD